MEQKIIDMFGSAEELAQDLTGVLHLFIEEINPDFDSQANKEAMLVLVHLIDTLRG